MKYRVVVDAAPFLGQEWHRLERENVLESGATMWLLVGSGFKETIAAHVERLKAKVPEQRVVEEFTV
jgi:hypothetical protein